MATEPAAGPGLLRAAGTGVLVALMSLAFSMSYAAVVFSGPLAPFRDAGISMAVFGSAVYAFASALSGSVPGTWWGNQASPVVLVALAASGIAAALADAAPATLFATVAVFTALSTFVAGLAIFLIGRARLGQQARFIPYPVIGGFLAATGYFLLEGGIELVTGAPLGLASLADPAALFRWGPLVIAGAGMMLASRWLGPSATLLGGVALYLLGFAAFLAFNGLGLAEAASMGLLLGGPGDGTGIVLALSEAGRADFAAVTGQVWTIGAIAFLTILGIVMSVSALEVQMGRSFDLDREMTRAGLASMAASAGCGFVGFHSVSVYQLSRALVRVPVPAIGLTAGAVIVAVLWGGLGYVAFVPKGAIALILVFLGIEFLWHWLVVARRSMPRIDFAIVATILATAIAFDFVVAIILGTIAASVLFTLAYSRVDVVRNRVSGRLRLSPTERPERDIATLVAKGEQTLIFELQGFLFFGTANGLFERVSAEITRPGASIHHLLIDFRRVSGLDVSASFALGRLVDLAVQRGVQVGFTGVSDRLRDTLGPLAGHAGLALYPTLADGLQRAEDDLLAGGDGTEGGGHDDPMSAFGALLAEATARGLPLVEERAALGAGGVLYAQGDPGDDLAYLAEGRLSAWITQADGSRARVASFLPGAVVGEIAFAAGTSRTASVVADEPSVILRVSRGSLERAAAEDPALAARFQAAIARLLAERLGRTTALVFAMDA
ncbi:cyclic nucleotide-binding domain-containing protein [Palleronia sp. KMU-117]|uniref:cyclic nucleotide-binding domain-containing protein n=1 Tax=Palleronia sp. KMU-117 TaxID=3434108 RepID=UPI003D72498B